MSGLINEVARFKTWAATLPQAQGGQWECDYDSWDALHAAFLEFLRNRAFVDWSPEERAAVLFAIARDNEIEYLARTIRQKHQHLLVPLARASLSIGESDDRWQLAKQLAHVDEFGPEHAELLLSFAIDQHEYVRRMALRALATTGSSLVERIAIEQWERSDPAQEWARMNCLWSLHRIRSPILDRYLAQADGDPRKYLREYAAKVRRGELEP